MHSAPGTLRRATALTAARPTIRVVLLLGFGLTLGLWLFAGYQFAQRFSEVQNEAAAINERYMRAQELLATVRSQILLGSVYVRDSLLAPGPEVLEDNRRRLDQTYRVINAALTKYVPVLESPLEEQDRIANLAREIEAYRRTMEQVLASSVGESPRAARRLLNEEVVPRRELVVYLSEEVQALNRSAFVRQQDAIGQIYRATQGQVWRQLGLALAASLGIALLATLYSGRLERHIREHAAREEKNRTDLQQLSARLVSLQEEERRGIARELHDEVGQALTALKVELAVAERAADSRSGPIAKPLGTARSIADGVLQAVRNLSRLLHPGLLDDLGLPAAVGAYARDFESRYRIRVEVAIEGLAERLAPEIEIAAYRIIQEALTNVARHSHATHCSLHVARDGDLIRLAVEDNGVGFHAGSRGEGEIRGLGLIGMRERATEVGGTFELDAPPGRGARVRVTLPARPRPEAAVPDHEAAPPLTERSDRWAS